MIREFFLSRHPIELAITDRPEVRNGSIQVQMLFLILMNWDLKVHLIQVDRFIGDSVAAIPETRKAIEERSSSVQHVLISCSIAPSQRGSMIVCNEQWIINQLPCSKCGT